MAEIPIERKKGTNWIPLILGLLAILLIFGYCFGMRGKDTAVVAADSTSSQTAAAGAGMAMAAGGANAAIDEFQKFVATRDTSTETEGQHRYTAEGTRLLANALEAVAAPSPSIAVYADSMRSAIDRLQASGPSDVHADDAKAAFSAAVTAMMQIDQARGRTRDVAPMRAIYSELSSKKPLMPQLPIVDRFFKAASEALQLART